MSQSRDSNYQGVWDGHLGFGQNPALVVIDFVKGYTTEESPLYAPGVVEAVRRAPELLSAARRAGAPVTHTNILFRDPDFADAGMWAKKAPIVKLLVPGNPLSEFCDEAVPAEGELVFTKHYPSAFFGTSLASTLHSMGVDTVLLAGCTTSGCIRASAVDAMQHGFRPIVVRDCVGDRHNDPHEANLFDIAAKYGDVVSLAEAVAALEEFADRRAAVK
ncbi:N-carbamoylsarcosine amidohydrolase [Paenarthrobacter sp. NPDC089714]|uniref:N-carbamoylsarcosine amidohydrolase n=1 Tax=Paenarthrobacter sp. NPDC089714 TaxID=3364377 RepID=UPI0037FB5301